MKFYQIIAETNDEDDKVAARRNFLKGKIKTNTLPKMDIPDATSIGQVVPYKSQEEVPDQPKNQSPDDQQNNTKKEQQPKSHSRRGFIKRIGGAIANAVTKTSLPGRAVQALIKQSKPFGEMPTGDSIWSDKENLVLDLKWFSVFSSNFAKTGQKAIVMALNPAHAVDLVKHWETPFPNDGGTIAKVVNAVEKDPEFNKDDEKLSYLDDFIFGGEPSDSPTDDVGLGLIFDKEHPIEKILNPSEEEIYEPSTDYIQAVNQNEYDPIHSFRTQYDADVAKWEEGNTVQWKQTISPENYQKFLNLYQNNPKFKEEYDYKVRELTLQSAQMLKKGELNSFTNDVDNLQMQLVKAYE